VHGVVRYESGSHRELSPYSSYIRRSMSMSAKMYIVSCMDYGVLRRRVEERRKRGGRERKREEERNREGERKRRVEERKSGSLFGGRSRP
jgi:hypothetical protein